MIDFNKKEYGLPLWAWSAIAVVLLIFGWRFYKSRASGGSGSVIPFPGRQAHPSMTEAEQGR